MLKKINQNLTYFWTFLRRLRVFCLQLLGSDPHSKNTNRALAMSLAFSQKCLYCPHIYNMCGFNLWCIYCPVMHCHYFPSLTKDMFLEDTEGINPAVKLNQVILTLFEGHYHGRHPVFFTDLTDSRVLSQCFNAALLREILRVLQPY